MTAQPSSQAEREDVARGVLASILADGGFPNEAADVRNGLDVELSDGWAIRAMLAFSDREHATPRSMPEEVVEAYERAAKVCDGWQTDSAAEVAVAMGMDDEALYVARRTAEGLAAAIRAIPGASA